MSEHLPTGAADSHTSSQFTGSVLNAIIESPAGVVIFALDREYRYLAFNSNHLETMRRIWGVNVVIGNSMLDYIQNPEDREKATRNFDRALSGESFIVIEEYGEEHLSRRYYENNYNPILDPTGAVIGLTVFLTDVTERKRMEEERDCLIEELKESLKKVKTLSGLLPVCANCKKIRNGEGEWEHIESYIRTRSEADFSHGICPECAEKLYPGYMKDR